MASALKPTQLITMPHLSDSSFARRSGYVGQALADALPFVSLDVIQIMAEYAREGRLTFQFGSFRNARCVTVNSRKEVCVGNAQFVEMFNRDGNFLRRAEFRFEVNGLAVDEHDSVFVACPYTLFARKPDLSPALEANTPNLMFVSPTRLSYHDKQLFVCYTDGFRVFRSDTLQLLYRYPCWMPLGCVVNDKGHVFVLKSASLMRLKPADTDRDGEQSERFQTRSFFNVSDPRILAYESVAMDRSGNILVCNKSADAFSKMDMFCPDRGEFTSLEGFDECSKPRCICLSTDGLIFVLDEPTSVDRLVQRVLVYVI